MNNQIIKKKVFLFFALVEASFFFFWLCVTLTTILLLYSLLPVIWLPRLNSASIRPCFSPELSSSSSPSAPIPFTPRELQISLIFIVSATYMPQTVYLLALFIISFIDHSNWLTFNIFVAPVPRRMGQCSQSTNVTHAGHSCTLCPICRTCPQGSVTKWHEMTHFRKLVTHFITCDSSGLQHFKMFQECGF